MSSVSKYLVHSLTDAWGISLFIYMYSRGGGHMNRVIFPNKIAQLRLLENLDISLNNLGLGYVHAKKVICTEYGLLFVFTAILIFILLTVFALFPTVVRVLAHLLILVLARKFLPDWDMLTDTQAAYAALVAAYTVVGIWRAIIQRKETDKLADVLIGSGTRRTSFWFFLSIVPSFMVLGLFHLLFRLLDFKEPGLFHLLVYIYFIASQLSTVKYMARCMYCLFFFRSRIPGFRPISAFELIPLAFTASLAGLLRPLNLLGVLFCKYLVFIGLEPTSIPIVRLLDNNRVKLFYAAVYSRPYFRSSVESRSLLWHGELREKMGSFRFLEPVLPLITVSCLTFLSVFSNVIDFFRTQDVFVIQFTYFFFIIEIFYTFAAVKLLEPYYNPASGDLSRRPSYFEITPSGSNVCGGAAVALIPSIENNGTQSCRSRLDVSAQASRGE